MNWHETIEYIRTNPEYEWLVTNAYLDKNLIENINKFSNSEEFEETLTIINQLFPNNKPKILDIGSGNGISAISFALAGFDVVALEPDPSDTIGVGAIKFLIDHYQLKNIDVIQTTAEDAEIKHTKFDLVYVRQALHHAYDLNKFVAQSSMYLKDGGYFFSVRDHFIFNNADKQLFLDTHPLHKFYGGENAFTLDEYVNAMTIAKLKLKKILHHFDSVINFSPLTIKEKNELLQKREIEINKALNDKIGILAKFPFVNYFSKLYFNNKYGQVYDETKIPGRLCSIIAQKSNV